MNKSYLFLCGAITYALDHTVWPKYPMRRIIPRMSQPRLIQTSSSAPGRKQKLLDEVRSVLRTRHLSLRTEQAYVQWIVSVVLT